MRRAGILTGDVRALILPAVLCAPPHRSFSPSTHAFVDHNRLWFDPVFPLSESHQPPAQFTHRFADVRIE
jgi:hypothetical protein